MTEEEWHSFPHANATDELEGTVRVRTEHLHLAWSDIPQRIRDRHEIHTAVSFKLHGEEVIMNLFDPMQDGHCVAIFSLHAALACSHDAVSAAIEKTYNMNKSDVKRSYWYECPNPVVHLFVEDEDECMLSPPNAFPRNWHNDHKGHTFTLHYDQEQELFMSSSSPITNLPCYLWDAMMFELIPALFNNPIDFTDLYVATHLSSHGLSNVIFDATIRAIDSHDLGHQFSMPGETPFAHLFIQQCTESMKEVCPQWKFMQSPLLFDSSKKMTIRRVLAYLQKRKRSVYILYSDTEDPPWSCINVIDGVHWGFKRHHQKHLHEMDLHNVHFIWALGLEVQCKDFEYNFEDFDEYSNDDEQVEPEHNQQDQLQCEEVLSDHSGDICDSPPTTRHTPMQTKFMSQTTHASQQISQTQPTQLMQPHSPSPSPHSPSPHSPSPKPGKSAPTAMDRFLHIHDDHHVTHNIQNETRNSQVGQSSSQSEDPYCHVQRRQRRVDLLAYWKKELRNDLNKSKGSTRKASKEDGTGDFTSVRIFTTYTTGRYFTQYKQGEPTEWLFLKYPDKAGQHVPDSEEAPEYVQLHSDISDIDTRTAQHRIQKQWGSEWIVADQAETNVFRLVLREFHTAMEKILADGKEYVMPKGALTRTMTGGLPAYQPPKQSAPSRRDASDEMDAADIENLSCALRAIHTAVTLDPLCGKNSDSAKEVLARIEKHDPKDFFTGHSKNCDAKVLFKQFLCDIVPVNYKHMQKNGFNVPNDARTNEIITPFLLSDFVLGQDQSGKALQQQIYLTSGLCFPHWFLLFVRQTCMGIERTLYSHNDLNKHAGIPFDNEHIASHHLTMNIAYQVLRRSKNKRKRADKNKEKAKMTEANSQCGA